MNKLMAIDELMKKVNPVKPETAHIEAIIKIIEDIAPQKAPRQSVEAARADGMDDEKVLKMITGSLYDWLAYRN